MKSEQIARLNNHITWLEQPPYVDQAILIAHDIKELMAEVDKAEEALEKKIPEPMLLKKCDEKTIIACPDCKVNLATAWYYKEEFTGLQCQGDIPPIAKHCKFCGKKFPKDWSDCE